VGTVQSRQARPPVPAQPSEAEPQGAAVLRAAVTLYHQRLLGDPAALGYVAGRGIDRATIERCQVGYAAGEQLLPLLRWRGLSLWAALGTGLVNRHGHEHLAGSTGGRPDGVRRCPAGISGCHPIRHATLVP